MSEARHVWVSRDSLCVCKACHICVSMPHMNESCHIWVSHVTWVSQVTCRATYEWVKSHTTATHYCNTLLQHTTATHYVVPHMSESSHILACHYQIEICCVCGKQIPQERTVSHLSEPCHTRVSRVIYKWVTLHTNESYHILTCHRCIEICCACVRHVA